MQRHFLEKGGLYRERAGETKRANVWPYSQALAAAGTLAALDDRYRADLQARLGDLRRYWNPARDVEAYDSSLRPPFGRGGWQFYDDNEWIGLELVRAYRALGDSRLLEQARRLFRFVLSGWDTDPSHACAGGVFWTRFPRNRDRNTVSTANGALLALELYQETRRDQYLEWGRRMYDWVERCLRAPDGLYWDHLDLEGRVEQRQWSYNQGAMLAAAVRLSQATGDTRYLGRAEEIARASLGRWAPEFRDEPPSFVAIFFRDLQLLDAVRPDPTYAAAQRGYADERWRQGRSAGSGLFDGELLEQAGMVQIYATLDARRARKGPDARMFTDMANGHAPQRQALQMPSPSPTWLSASPKHTTPRAAASARLPRPRSSSASSPSARPATASISRSSPS
jgi:hypothetical protein